MSSDHAGPTVPVLLSPDGLSTSIKAAVDKALADLPTGDKGGAQVSFTHVGATAKVFVRVKDIETGAFVDRTWNGDVTAGGYISWRF
jgi:hypothetical protein